MGDLNSSLHRCLVVVFNVEVLLCWWFYFVVCGLIAVARDEGC